MFSISYIVHYLIIMFVRTMKHGLKTLGFTYTNNMNLINRIGTIQWHYKGLMNHVNIIVYCKPNFYLHARVFLEVLEGHFVANISRREPVLASLVIILHLDRKYKSHRKNS